VEGFFFPNESGLFDPAMLFGLTNSPAPSKTMMNDILSRTHHEGYLAIYMAYILVYTCTRRHYQEIVT